MSATSTVHGVSTTPFWTATERDALCSFLDQARDALIRKVDGLSDKDARWVAMHLIQETARHAGHADIIRETVDGKVAFQLLAEEQGTPWN